MAQRTSSSSRGGRKRASRAGRTSGRTSSRSRSTSRGRSRSSSSSSSRGSSSRGSSSRRGGRKYGPKAGKKVERAMHEMKRGQLRSGGSGKRVTSRKQAIAIGLSEARRAGGKVPSRGSSRSRSSRKK